MRLKKIANSYEEFIEWKKNNPDEKEVVFCTTLEDGSINYFLPIIEE